MKQLVPKLENWHPNLKLLTQLENWYTNLKLSYVPILNLVANWYRNNWYRTPKLEWNWYPNLEFVLQFGIGTPIWNWYPNLVIVPQYGIPKYVLQISIDAPIWKSYLK